VSDVLFSKGPAFATLSKVVNTSGLRKHAPEAGSKQPSVGMASDIPA